MGMLVQTRKVGQKIRIGDEIEITVLEIDGKRVRLGFLAPSEVAVHRLEVWERIRQEAAEGRERPAPARKCSEPGRKQA